MKNRRYLHELDKTELRQVFDNNQDIRNIAFENAIEDIYYFIENEYISYFRHYSEFTTPHETYSADFEDDSYGNIYVTVYAKNYRQFLIDCLDCQSFYLDDKPELIALIKRLQGKVDLYEDIDSGYSDMSDNNENQFLTWFDDGIEKISHELKYQIEVEQSAVYDDDYIFDRWYELDIENSDMYIIDGDLSTVYEDITRKYA